MYDSILKALADEERRQLLFDLLEANPRPDSPGVSENRQASPEEFERRQVALYHKHLPLLDDAGFVTWNREANEVVKGPRFEYLKPVLQFLEEYQEELPDEWDDETAE